MTKNWNLRLKEKREEAGITLNEAGEKCGRHLSQQSLIKYEKGEVFPRIDILEDLCSIYKCSINYVLYGSDDANVLVSKNDYLITLWYLLATRKLEFDGNCLKIADESLKENITYLNIYLKKIGVSSFDDLLSLMNGIEKMKS